MSKPKEWFLIFKIQFLIVYLALYTFKDGRKSQGEDPFSF